MYSPNSNPESTNFLTNFIYDFCLNNSNWEKFVKQIGYNIGWIRYQLEKIIPLAQESRVYCIVCICMYLWDFYKNSNLLD